MLKKGYTVIIKEWEKKVPIGESRPTYYTASSKLPKKYKDTAVLKKFGKSKQYWVDKGTLKKIVKKEGVTKTWNLNGQAFYSATIHWRLRSIIVGFYHKIFVKEIKKVIKTEIPFYTHYSLSISVDIYDIYSRSTPDASNMWLLEKMFEDALQIAKVLRDDRPEYVIESGRKRYYWVDNTSERKLVFRIKYIKI